MAGPRSFSARPVLAVLALTAALGCRTTHEPPGKAASSPVPDAGAEPPVCEVVVTDDGPAFDPLGAPEPDMSLGVEERPVGGLGIALVRKLMDETEYERRDGKNRLRLRRRLVPMEG